MARIPSLHENRRKRRMKMIAHRGDCFRTTGITQRRRCPTSPRDPKSPTKPPFVQIRRRLREDGRSRRTERQEAELRELGALPAAARLHRPPLDARLLPRLRVRCGALGRGRSPPLPASRPSSSELNLSSTASGRNLRRWLVVLSTLQWFAFLSLPSPSVRLWSFHRLLPPHSPRAG